jgi:hypothetical protein
VAVNAHAAGYWNVYQDYMAAGTHATSIDTDGNSAYWHVRMSWTPNSQNMYFLIIDYGGSWHSYWALPDADQVSGYWDRKIDYIGFIRGGCQNPANGGTPYVNCRNASTL